MSNREIAVFMLIAAALFALLVFTSDAAQFVVTNDTLSINCEARTMEVRGGDKFKYTLYARTTIGTPESLANRIVRGSVIDVSDGYADTQKVVSAELVSDTNGVARFETTMSGLEDGNYLWRVGVWQTNGTYVKEIACDRLLIWSGCDTCSVLRVDLGNLLVSVTNNLVAPGVPDGYMPYVSNGLVALGPAPAGGGSGTQTAQVNRIRINGTNYQGDLDVEAGGLLRLAPTGLTINAYVGTDDAFAGLQSYASPLTNVIAWNVGGQPVGMSPLVPGYQLTTDGSNWYLGADAAGTAISTNAIYQIGHNGSIIGPLNTLIFGGSPVSIAALGGGTGAVYVAGYTNNNRWASATVTTGTVTYASGVAKSLMPTGATSHIRYYGDTNLIDTATWEYVPGVPGAYCALVGINDVNGANINYTARMYRNGAEWWPMQAANVLGGPVAVDSGNIFLRSPPLHFNDPTGTNRWSPWIEYASGATAGRASVEYFRIGDYIEGLP